MAVARRFRRFHTGGAVALSIGVRRAIIKARPVLRVLNKPVLPGTLGAVRRGVKRGLMGAAKGMRKVARRMALPVARAAQASSSPTPRRAYAFARAAGRHATTQLPKPTGKQVAQQAAFHTARAYLGHDPVLMGAGVTAAGTIYAAKKAGKIVRRLAPTAREKGLKRMAGRLERLAGRARHERRMKYIDEEFARKRAGITHKHGMRRLKQFGEKRAREYFPGEIPGNPNLKPGAYAPGRRITGRRGGGPAFPGLRMRGSK